MDGVKAAPHLGQPVDILVSPYNSARPPSGQTRDGSLGAYKGGSRSTPPNTAVGNPGALYLTRDPGRYVSYGHGGSPSGLPTAASAFRSAEERGQAGPSRRLTLLHPPPQPPSEYILPQATTPHTPRSDRPSQAPHYGGMVKLVTMNESPPCKKLRLGDSKPDVHTPLRIETDRARSGPAYNPQVEAISPTLPSESLRDESPLRSTKEELLQQIARVDREIAKTESQIAKLKKKKVELEEAATQPKRDTKEEAIAADTFIRTLPQRIYSENRKRALAAHNLLEKLGPKVDLPLYNQPSDSALYHDNKLKYNSFKSKLLEFFKGRLKEKSRREEYLTTTYSKLSNDFSKKLEKKENNAKNRAKEAKNRETFEKVFPELRKQREDKERFSRVGSRIKSDADLEEIMDGLHEQELEDKKMRSYAVIPPILLDERARKRRFKNTNGLIEDPMQEYKEKPLLNIWTDQEKDIFKEKYLQHPKNFGIIKSYLERKSVADCVQYYYLSKKTQNYRGLLRKNRARTRSTRNNQQAAAAAAQQQQQQQQQQSSSISAPSLPLSIKNEPNGPTIATRGQKESKAASAPPQPPPPEPSPPNNAPPTNAPLDVDQGANTSCQTTVQSDYSGQPKKRSEEGGKETLPVPNNEMDTSDEEHLENGDKGGPHNCGVCKTSLESFLQSRPLLPANAPQYGLAEEDISEGDRVCTSCRCKAGRRRYKPNQCPIPTCPARRTRIKRLRPFPPLWADLPEETKEAICAKYQIAPNVTKCCTACFNRISRRLGPNANLDTPDDPQSDTTRWTDEEIETFKKALTEHGTDWRKLSERLGSKSELHCRNFYFNFRKKLALDSLVQEFRKSKGGDGPPILTDEEESGSTTSSCDEGVNPPQDNSRPSDKKDDYDSSATVSAEEGASIESDLKAQSVEELKTLPNNPETPLQLTMRGSHRDVRQPSPSHIPPQQVRRDHPPQSHSIRHPMHNPMPHTAIRFSSPEASEGSHEVKTVKDLMLKTIERQLRINPVPQNSNQVHPGPSVSPTITSILKSQERTIPGHMMGSGSSGGLGGHFTGQGMYYTKEQRPGLGQSHGLREGMPIIQVQQREEFETLDLSMKKRAPSPHTDRRPPSNGPPPAHQPLDYARQQQQQQQQQPPHGEFYPKYTPVPRPRAQHLGPPMAKQPKVVPPPPPLLTKAPALSPMKDGSITHGTPMHPQMQVRFQEGPFAGGPPPQPRGGGYRPNENPQAGKYEGLLRPSKEGSITQGTPLDKRPVKQEFVVYDQASNPNFYAKRLSPAQGGFYQQHPGAYYPPRLGGQRTSPPSAQHVFSEQHKQLIINDYYTSQQMQQPPPQSPQGPPRMDPKRSVQQYHLPPRHEVPYRQSPPPQPPQHAQQRQGVIHRANSHRIVKIDSNARYGHDAFASLVDIAAAQPALPVPKEDNRGRVGLPRVDMVREGLGKSMAEMERNRLSSSQIHQPPPAPSPSMYRTPPAQPQPPVTTQGDSQRMRRDIESGRYNRDPTDQTLTAASLIDAIITHQINQPSVHDRHSPAPAARSGDRLFASLKPYPGSAPPHTSGGGLVMESPAPRNPDPSDRGSEVPHMHYPHDRRSQDHVDSMPCYITQIRHPDRDRGVDLVRSMGGRAEVELKPIEEPRGVEKPHAGEERRWEGRGGPMHLQQPQHHPQLMQQPHHPPKKDEDMTPYVSWKLRRALQHKEEQAQAQHMRNPGAKDHFPPMTEEEGKGGSGGEVFARGRGSREGISPLDYMKNRIIEVMRTENSEEAKEEEAKSARGSPSILPKGEEERGEDPPGPDPDQPGPSPQPG